MGGVGFTEVLLLVVVALLVVGPRRLPELARAAGSLSRQARKAWLNLQSEFRAELDAEHNRRIMEAAEQAREELKHIAAGREDQSGEPRAGD